MPPLRKGEVEVLREPNHEIQHFLFMRYRQAAVTIKTQQCKDVMPKAAIPPNASERICETRNWVDTIHENGNISDEVKITPFTNEFVEFFCPFK